MPDWLRGFFWACLTVLLPLQVQAATYAYRNDTFAYDTPTGGASAVTWHAGTAAPACTSYPNGDDDWADIVFPGGFGFTFGGVKYTGVRVYSNGILAFGNDVSGFHRDYTSQALPITAAPGGGGGGCTNAVPERLMVAYWIDIVAGTANSTTGASVKYEILGVAPSRRFVISWDNVKLYNQTARYNFQIALYESPDGVNGNFRYQYTAGSSNGANATVGVQLSTTDYTQYSFNQQFIDTTNGTAILWYPANQLASKRAEYRFDESAWTGAASEVKDTSGNSRHATRQGAASNVANGKLCRGGGFTSNTANNVIDGVMTPLTPGTSGSFDFWFNSDSAWNANDAMLLDATTVANRPFFLMKRSTGALRFVVTDGTGTSVTANTGNLSYAAGTWQHVGVTWNVRGGTNLSLIQIFVNGVLVASQRGTTNGTLGEPGTVMIGDNRTSGVTPANGTGRGANGRIDEFYAYELDVSGPQIEADMNLTRPTCTTLDHFRIQHGGTAACNGTAAITITAHDQNHQPFTLSGTTMTVSTSTGQGTWSAITAINSVTNLGGGQATYTFANENSVVLGLTSAVSGPVNIDVASGTVTEHSGAAATCVADDYTYGTACDAALTFGACVSTFECLETGIAYTNLTTFPSARNPLHTKLAGTPLSFDVVAVDASGNRSTSYAADADKTVTVELVNGSGATACASRTALSPAMSQSLTFAKVNQPTEQGRKAVSFTVAKAYPNLRCRVAAVSPALTACSSDNFAVRPSDFSVTSTANADSTGTNTTASPRFAAGVTNITLTAASGVVGYEGQPKIDASKVQGHISAARSGSVGGSFSNADGLTGTATGSNFSYSEVGYFRFDKEGVYDDTFTVVDSAVGDCSDNFQNTLVSGRYGCKFGNAATSDYFGRFTPDHFDTTVSNACGGFTYSGQPFPLRVTALAAGGSVTENYQGGFAKAVTLSDANTAAGAFSPATINATSFSKGVADLTTPASVAFAYAAKLTLPSVLRVRVADADTISSATGSEGTTPLRSGRLRLSNVYGYASPLRMPVQAQYWGGVSWVPNADDACTVLAAASVKLDPAGWGVVAPGTLVAGGGAIMLTPTAAGSVNVCADLGPDNGVACSATTAARPWLQSRWPGGPNYNNDPGATATFGVYSPESRRGIYNRELY